MNRILNTKLRDPKTLQIVLAQSVDISLGLALLLSYISLMGLFFSDANFTWLDPKNIEIQILLLSILGWTLNMTHRLFFLIFLGATLGQYLTRVRACHPINDPRLWIGQALESLYIVLPILWVFEIAGRLLGSPFRGLRYIVLSNADLESSH